MRKYNSVFTLAFSVLHNEKDGSDITSDEFAARIHRRVSDLVKHGELCEAVGGPEDSGLNETPLRCPVCMSTDFLEIRGEVYLPVKQSPGEEEFQAQVPAYDHKIEYHDHSYTICENCGHNGELKDFYR